MKTFFSGFYNAISPLNMNPVDHFSFKRLFVADYGRLVPTDLTVWIILSAALTGLFFAL